MGKGVIVPVKWFVLKHLAKVAEKHKEVSAREKFPDAFTTLDEVVKELYGKNMNVSSLGHDAFESRHGFASMGVFDGSDHREALDHLEVLSEECTQELPEELEEYENLHCGDLMFIGFSEDIVASAGGEFEYYVKPSEIIYGLTVLIPSIIKLYPTMLEFDAAALKDLGNPLVWTFSSDCHCCG